MNRPNQAVAMRVSGGRDWTGAAFRVIGFNPEAANLMTGVRHTIEGSTRGVRYKANVIEEAFQRGVFACATVMEVALDMSDEFEASIEKADEARKKLIDSFKNFRGEVKNDISSITAAGDRVREETRKIQMAFENVHRLMNSTEMLNAIQNVERLVTALKAMQELQGTKIAFAMLNQETPVTPYEELSPEEKAGWRQAIKQTVGA